MYDRQIKNIIITVSIFRKLKVIILWLATNTMVFPVKSSILFHLNITTHMTSFQYYF